MRSPAKRSSRLRAFFSYYRPRAVRRLFILDMICATVIALVDLAFPIVTRHALNAYLPARLYTAFFWVMGGLALGYVLRTVMQYIVTYYGHMMGVHMEAAMRRDIFRQMQRLSFRFYDRNRTGQLMSRVTNDLFEITELAHHGPEDLFISLVTLI
ncbi:MAG: ABC transporter transmembrane domain-containing protein, partial [Clostridia bacterium]|nr:ABC transporter transmembrane domain-containing protein [Clostridia bacterium]